MSNPVMVVHRMMHGTGERLGRACWIWCPGCDDAHRVVVEQAAGKTGPVWEWDGNLDAPTVSPSILVRWTHAETGEHRCHSFLRAGRWEYLSDCTHALAGQTVAMKPLPDWLVREGS